jgi:hypothetical protein
MIKIIDNFLEPSYLRLIQKCFETNFPWYYLNNISTPDFSKNNTSFGFYHILVLDKRFTNSKFVPVFEKLIFKMLESTELKTILKVRADMTVFSKEETIHQPHNDFLAKTDGLSEKFLSAIFYVNDSDGDTVIFNEKRLDKTDKMPDLKDLTIKEKITPKENRFVMFSGSYIHTGHSPSNHKNRILINANFDV